MTNFTTILKDFYHYYHGNLGRMESSGWDELDSMMLITEGSWGELVK